MIFRLDGEVSELLALTPVIREWRKRNNGASVLVETNIPEIFNGNCDVEKAATYIDEIDDFYDLNLVTWKGREMSVSEVYAESVFGDRNLSTWKPFMFQDPIKMEQIRKSNEWIPAGKKVAAVAFSGRMIATGSAEEAIDEIGQMGYIVSDVSHMNDFGLVLAIICQSDLFVGEDGDEAAIALTTDKPAVVCYSYRVPSYFPPFRKAIPFVPLVPDRCVCENHSVCFAQNPHMEYSKFYSIACQNKLRLNCVNREIRHDVMKAICRIDDKA